MRSWFASRADNPALGIRPAARTGATTALLPALLGGIMLAAAGACDGEAKPSWPEAGAIEAVVLPPRPTAPPGAMLFESLPAQRTGIDFAARWPHHLTEYRGHIDIPMAGGGVAIGDYTGDGLPDVYLTRAFGGGRLYRNLGDFRFHDATEEAGLGDDTAWPTGATFADINNNGLLDLYIVGNHTPNRLYINRGDGTFVERAAEHGLDHTGAGVMAAFADYTGNGHLDAYLANNRPGGDPEPPRDLVRDEQGRFNIHPDQRGVYELIVWTENGRTRHTVVNAGQSDRLYRNNGDGTFTDASAEAGIAGYHETIAAIWWDYNGNGLPDLYVASDFYGPDRLYRNNGDGTFTDAIGEMTGRTPWFSMGVDAADINNNGRLDLMATDMAERTHYGRKTRISHLAGSRWFRTVPEPRHITRNTLYLNTGAGRFIDVAPMLAIEKSDWTWAALFGDLNNSGWNDLFITNGMTRDLTHRDRRPPVRRMPEKRDQNLAFRNAGNLAFEDVSAAWGLDHVGISFGAAMADLNGNGNLDIIVNNFDEAVSVYRNTESEGRRAKVRLRGRVSNSHGIGATVRIHTAAGRQMRYLTLARGFMSSTEPIVHFGLGDVEVIDRLIVEWPSGHVQEFTGLPADHLYTIVEPSAPPPARLPLAARS